MSTRVPPFPDDLWIQFDDEGNPLRVSRRPFADAQRYVHAEICNDFIEAFKEAVRLSVKVKTINGEKMA